jgi:tetraacyldisaccharide 4'-kinase
MNSLASLIFPPLSVVYGAVTRARLTAFRRGWLATSRLAAPVISVGNLTTGGTGKTPLVEWICKAAARETGKKICVLTRGYGRPNPQSQVVVSDGVTILGSVSESGDEPYLLAQNLVGVAAVISNPDRLAAGNWAMKNLGSEVFVLDDGFQHLQLARDLDIVTIDATNPWGGGSSLPAGRLREPRSGVARADCVVITRTEQVENTAAINDTVRQLTSAIPILFSRMMTSGVRTLGGRVVDQTSLLAHPVAAFCGLGNPESFFSGVRCEGFKTAFTKAFPDHHNYTQSEVTGLVHEAKLKGAEALLTTAKDAIKLASFELAIPCYVLDIQISIDDEGRLVELIRNACSKATQPKP